MASRSLRPLSIGEILDAGIKVVIRHWKVLAICVVGLVGPMNVIQVLLRASIDPNAFESGDTTSTTTDIGPAAIGLIGSAFLSGLAFLVAFTACFKAVADAWLGAEPAVGRSLKFGARRLGATLVAWIAWIFILVIGFILLIVPGFYFGVVFCLTLPALLFEGIGPFRAFGRSRSLVSGRWWPTLGLVAVGYLLVSIIGAIVQAILIAIAGASSSSVVPAAIATVIGSTISNAVTTPYLAAVLTILYFDMRVRKEGFDLQLMAGDLGRPHDPDAPLPAPLIGEDFTPEQKASAPYWPPPPGWTPPPPSAPEPAHASWQPPSATGSPWGESTGPPAAAPAEPEPDEPPGAAEPEPDEPPAGEEPERREPPPPKPDPNRAGWLPPEAPRGPGGL